LFIKKKLKFGIIFEVFLPSPFSEDTKGEKKNGCVYDFLSSAHLEGRSNRISKTTP